MITDYQRIFEEQMQEALETIGGLENLIYREGIDPMPELVIMMQCIGPACFGDDVAKSKIITAVAALEHKFIKHASVSAKEAADEQTDRETDCAF